MPTLYCPDCGNPNRYVGSKPPKCCECEYSFAVSNPKPPTKQRKEIVLPKIRAKVKARIEPEDEYEDEEEDDGYDTRRRRISKAEVLEEYTPWNLREEVSGGNAPRRISFKSQVGNAPRTLDTRTASRETIERQRQSYFPPDKVNEVGDGA